MAELPRALTGLREEVEAALDRDVADRVEGLATLHGELGPVVDHLRSVLLQGGKRLRPVLLLAGHGLAGGDPRAVMGPALGVELVHTCALVHDDLIDDAGTRRGRPTTHVAFARRHAVEDMVGSAERYGGAVAILLGDLALVLADELYWEATVSRERLLAALPRFSTLRREVMVGQYLDVAAAQRRRTSRELVLLVATVKSGRYTITRPLQLGAALAGADDDLLQGLERYGEPLGRAFQVRDDLLGVFGDEAETGKSAASDLREGKQTLLVVEARRRLEGGTLAEFEALLGSRDLDDEGVDRLRGLLRSCGAVAAVERQVSDWAGRARAAVGTLDVRDPWSGALVGLTDWVVSRRA